jgi:hypothetical protein
MPDHIRQRLQRDAAEVRIARCVEARRPYGDGGFAGCDGEDAAADAALAGQADAIGEFALPVIMPAGQHQRVDAPRPLGGYDRQAGRGISA